MDIRTLTPDYSVSPQIAAQDVQALRDAGFTAIICNRPDAENPPQDQAAAIEAAAREAGLAFHYNPVTNGAMTDDNLVEQDRILSAAKGPILAYCRSGTRSTVVWALVQAGRMPADDIVATAGRAGYDIAGIAPQLQERQLPD